MVLTNSSRVTLLSSFLSHMSSTAYNIMKKRMLSKNKLFQEIILVNITDPMFTLQLCLKFSSDKGYWFTSTCNLYLRHKVVQVLRRTLIVRMLAKLP